MYLIKNSENRLRIELMNLTKDIMPIPFYVTDFKTIYDINAPLLLN